MRMPPSGAGAPLGGILIAILVLSPEGLTAFHAALANQLQRAVNVCLGSALATIGLTIPAVLAIGLITGQEVHLGLDRTAEGERAYEQSEHQQRRVGAVKPKMHLLPGDQPDGEHRRNGEADSGERRPRHTFTARCS